MSSIIFNIPEGYILDKKSSTRTAVVYKKVVSLPSTTDSIVKEELKQFFNRHPEGCLLMFG
jgi:hypothetical protein